MTVAKLPLTAQRGHGLFLVILQEICKTDWAFWYFWHFLHLLESVSYRFH
jgi:hypothetical protein